MSKYGHQTPEALANAIEARVNALAKAHELIVPVVTAASAEGTATTLGELLTTILAPHIGLENTQLSLEGPSVKLGAKATTNLSLAFHELATNATKYGALCADHGKLKVCWKVDRDTLQVNWHETAPNALKTATPEPGFGTQLIDICVTHQLQGEISKQISAEGWSIALNIPGEMLPG